MARPVLVTAGFDAYREDPLADLMWSAGDYAALARRVLSYAPRPGRFVAFLQGGYHLNALRRSVMATVAAIPESLADDEPPMSGGRPRRAAPAEFHPQRVAPPSAVAF
jgi:acetoin utilization deacetylase AcuC-like enzyme